MRIIGEAQPHPTSMVVCGRKGNRSPHFFKQLTLLLVRGTERVAVLPTLAAVPNFPLYFLRAICDFDVALFFFYLYFPVSDQAGQVILRVLS